MTNAERAARYVEVAAAIHGTQDSVTSHLHGDESALHHQWSYFFGAYYSREDYEEHIPLSLCFAAAMAEGGDL